LSSNLTLNTEIILKITKKENKMLRAFRLTQKRLQPLARARAERRQYTVEELSGNKWHFPDEDTSVSFTLP
jgi:hypothetical protein